MSLITLPVDVKKEVLNFMQPAKLDDLNQVKESARFFANFSCTCKEFYKVSQDYVKQLEPISKELAAIEKVTRDHFADAFKGL